MSNKLVIKVAKTVVTEFTIDLDECYSWEDRTEKEKHNQMNSCLENPEDLIGDAAIIHDRTEEVEVLDWDIEK